MDLKLDTTIFRINVAMVTSTDSFQAWNNVYEICNNRYAKVHFYLIYWTQKICDIENFAKL